MVGGISVMNIMLVSTGKNKGDRHKKALGATNSAYIDAVHSRGHNALS